MYRIHPHQTGIIIIKKNRFERAVDFKEIRYNLPAFFTSTGTSNFHQISRWQRRSVGHVAFGVADTGGVSCQLCYAFFETFTLEYKISLPLLERKKIRHDLEVKGLDYNRRKYLICWQGINNLNGIYQKHRNSQLGLIIQIKQIFYQL